MTQRTVNARQLEVLKWIGQGCPPGLMPDDSYKASAAALKSRRLVKITRKSGMWHADITDAGRHLLQFGKYPDRHWGETSNNRVWRVRPESIATTGLRPVDQMIANIVAAGGRLEIEGKRNYWDNMVASATRYGKAPVGKVLTVERGASWSQFTLVLSDAPQWMRTDPAHVPVPARLQRAHPVVASVRDDAKQLPFARPLRQRALRILEGLAREAERLSHQVRAPRNRRGYGPLPGELEIGIRGHDYVLRLTEESDRVPHDLTLKERREQDMYGHSWAPKYDYLASGRLRITISGGWTIHVEKVADTKTKTLEDKLGNLLLEVELRAAAADDRAQTELRKAEQRRHQWEEIHAQAQVHALQAYHTRVLHERASAWRQVIDLGDYVAAAEHRLTSLPSADQDAAREWIRWARERITALDPLAARNLTMPPAPEFTADMLEPFMRGLSPYGPDGW